MNEDEKIGMKGEKYVTISHVCAHICTRIERGRGAHPKNVGSKYSGSGLVLVVRNQCPLYSYSLKSHQLPSSSPTPTLLTPRVSLTPSSYFSFLYYFTIYFNPLINFSFLQLLFWMLVFIPVRLVVVLIKQNSSHILLEFV